MAVKVGSKSVNLGRTGGWYKVGSFNPAIDSQVSMNTVLTTIQADAKSVGLRARIVAWDVVITSDIFSLGASASNGFCSRQQRMAFFQLKITQPNLTAPYTDKYRSLAEWNMRSRLVNPLACALVQEHKYVSQAFTEDQFLLYTGETARVANVRRSFESNASLPNLTQDYVSRIDPTKGWETDTQLIASESTAGVATLRWQDHNVIPATINSGAGMMYDTIPLELCTDQNSPWIFYLQPKSIASANVTSLFHGAPAKSAAKEAELWVYISLVPTSSDWVFGVLYQHIDYPQSGQNMILDPHYYHHLAVYPDFNTTVADKGYAMPIAYDNFMPLIQGSLIRQFVNEAQTFPLVKESEYQHFIDGFNAMACRFSQWPELLFSDNATSTVVGIGGISTGPFTSPLGNTSEFPIFPIIANSFAGKGFPNGFISIPVSGDKMRVQVEQVSLTAGQLSRVQGTWVSDKFTQDSMVLRAASQLGAARYDTSMTLAQFNPLTLRRTGKDQLVAPLCPNVATNPG